MNAIPLTRAATVLPFANFLDRLGAPTERFLKQANLPICAFKDPETLIPLTQSFAFVEQAARSEGIENLGILVGQQTQVTALGRFGTVVCQSLTLHEFLHKVLKFHSTLLTGEQIWLTEDHDYLWLHHQYTVPQHICTYQGQYYAVLMYLNAIRLATGSHWQPDELHLSGPHKLSGFLDLDFLGNTPIHFHQETNAIRFSKAMLSKPLIHLATSSLCTTEETLRQTAPAIDFSESLSQLIRSLLPGGYPHLEVVAEAAGMSVRTFQRRLEDSNLNYSRLVEQIRFEQATYLLQDSTNKLIDIAFDLGYTDPANFSKAFKRWTGISPREFRNLYLHEEKSNS
uniref:AraC family transcriptional regulator n=1 Tax=Oscillatoriales cyanobacterium SpSt-402 TaxID=2282168 RepID=A0A832H9Z7_9CYAN